MKSNFFKIVLPAFALMLAITASLAFTSANMEDEATVEITTVWYQNPNITDCVINTQASCQVEPNANAEFCTVNVFGNKRVYLKNPQELTECTVVLYTYDPLQN